MSLSPIENTDIKSDVWNAQQEWEDEEIWYV